LDESELVLKHKYNASGIIVLASYPRSGNTLSRILLEKLTGVYTGSIYYDKRLNKAGWKGEGHSSNVIFVKTHYPLFPKGTNLKYSKILHLVRNPFDSLLSFFNYRNTNAHDETISAAKWEELSKQFSKFINKSSDDWVKFHEHWNSQRGSHPYLRIRYEDLMASPREILQQIVEFSFEGQKDTLEFVRSKLDCTYERN